INPLDHPLQLTPRVPINCPSNLNPLKTKEIPFKGYTLSNIKVYSDSLPFKYISENQEYLKYELSNTTDRTTSSTATPKGTTNHDSSIHDTSQVEISVADLLQPPSNLNDFTKRPELASIFKSNRLSTLSATLIELIFSEQMLHNSTAKLIRTIQRDDPQFLHINYGPLEKQVKEAAYALYGATGEIMTQLGQAREGIASLLHQQNYLWKVIRTNARSKRPIPIFYPKHSTMTSDSSFSSVFTESHT
ncbi:hypothetical protein HMI54_015633, partial [Coelomomyces lativittatus]